MGKNKRQQTKSRTQNMNIENTSTTVANCFVSNINKTMDNTNVTKTLNTNIQPMDFFWTSANDTFVSFTPMQSPFQELPHILKNKSNGIVPKSFHIAKKQIPRKVRKRQIERIKRALNYMDGLESKRVAKTTKTLRKERWKHLYE